MTETVWERMTTTINLWTGIKIYKHVCRDMELYDNVWNTHDNGAWQRMLTLEARMNMHEHVGKCMKKYANVWQCLELYQHSLKFMGMYQEVTKMNRL